MKIAASIVAATCLVSLSACGGGGSTTAASPTTAPTVAPTTAAASPSPTVTKIGNAAICTLLLNDGKRAPIARAVKMLGSSTPPPAYQVSAITAKLDAIQRRASDPTMAANLATVAKEFHDLELGSKTDTSDFRASGYEVTSLCDAEGQ